MEKVKSGSPRREKSKLPPTYKSGKTIMTQITLEDISADELYALKDEIDSFLNTADAAERAYCEGCSEYEQLEDDSQDRARQMKQRVKSLAIALGIHGEFLDEYVASCASHGLKLVVAA